MITKVQGEAPFQVLTNNFSISPSNEGYTLQISADGINYSNLFSVGANVTRLVTGVAANSYYRLLGNNSQVSINWMKTCVTEGGGSGSGTTYTAGDYISLEGDVISVTGITPDAYLTSADTQDLASKEYVTGITNPIQTQVDDIERVTATALTELHDSILELSGATGNSNILAAITSLAEYEAISGDVKTGDLIQVYMVDINADGVDEEGLFEAYVGEEEDQGVITRTIDWVRRDNADSLLYSDKDYPWMDENGTIPVLIGMGAFIISDTENEDEYNGIGFDGDGKPVIAHITALYDGDEITGMTREDTSLDLATKEQVIASALTQLNETKVAVGEDTGLGQVKTIVKISQSDYDDLVTNDEVDPDTLYIIIANS